MPCSFRYIKTSGNATVDHLSKYLAVRLALEELRSKGESNQMNLDTASEKQYTIYIATASGQFTVSICIMTVDSVSSLSVASSGAGPFRVRPPIPTKGFVMPLFLLQARFLVFVNLVSLFLSTMHFHNCALFFVSGIKWLLFFGIGQ